jgi:hypothetical protein
MLAWYDWLIIVGIPLLSIPVAYGLLSSYCRRAAVQADGIQLTTIFGRSILLPWSDVRRAELFFPFRRLVLGITHRFWDLRSGYVVSLAKLADPDEFLSHVNRHVLVKRVKSISELSSAIADRFRK